MPELREDLTTKDWVVFATERARRPHDFGREQSHAETLPARVADCPFCPGNESQTPGEIDRLVLAGARDWTVRVVPNRFAAFVPDGDPHRITPLAARPISDDCSDVQPDRCRARIGARARCVSRSGLLGEQRSLGERSDRRTSSSTRDFKSAVGREASKTFAGQ